MSKNLLGVDFGTTSLKACLFDEQGNKLSTKTAQYKLITSGDYIEFDAEEFFDIFLKVFREIESEYKVDAMAIDTQGETLIVLDKDGKPLMNAIIWLDNRAAEQAKKIERIFGLKNVYEVTGQAEVPAGYPAPKILWLKENEKELFKRADKFLLLEDYIIYRLTGKFAASRSLYSSSLLLNIKTGEYWEEMLNYLGITEKNLPELYESGEAVGKYNGITVVASALDQIAGITGAGIIKTGIMSEMTGTSLAVSTLTKEFPPFYDGLKVSVYYVSRGVFCLLMWAPTAGATLEWFKNSFCPELTYRQIDDEAEQIKAGSEGLICLPHLCGTVMPENNPFMRGLFCGIELKHVRGHFLRAIMESVAYLIKEYADYIGLSISEIRSIGGGSNSRLWCEIKSGVLGKDVLTLKESETGCLGSAIFSGVGIGCFANIEAAVETIVEKKHLYKPENNYTEFYKKYKTAERAARELCNG